VTIYVNGVFGTYHGGLAGMLLSVWCILPSRLLPFGDTLTCSGA